MNSRTFLKIKVKIENVGTQLSPNGLCQLWRLHCICYGWGWQQLLIDWWMITKWPMSPIDTVSPHLFLILFYLDPCLTVAHSHRLLLCHFCTNTVQMSMKIHSGLISRQWKHEHFIQSCISPGVDSLCVRGNISIHISRSAHVWYLSLRAL